LQDAPRAAGRWVSFEQTGLLISSYVFVGTLARMRLDAARKFALSLPETTEEPHFEKSSFRVKKKIFATVPEGGKHLHICVEPEEARVLIAEDPITYEPIVWGKKLKADWIRVNLPKASAAQVKELLEEAWRTKAPKRVLDAYDAMAHRGASDLV
jgi:hypothetical protein